jgi:hypothetical protein
MVVPRLRIHTQVIVQVLPLVVIGLSTVECLVERLGQADFAFRPPQLSLNPTLLLDMFGDLAEIRAAARSSLRSPCHCLCHVEDTGIEPVRLESCKDSPGTQPIPLVPLV